MMRSGLSRRTAIWLSALTATVVYLGVLGNRWSLDDQPIVERNPASHSVTEAVRSFFEPYWPTERSAAGQYRPLVIVSFAIDWVISGGAPWWFHLSNALMHALATALVVMVASVWLPPGGLLVAGVVFAVHPVHVEAVAGVVGRAEILAAIGLLVAVLLARRFRRAESARARNGWLAATAGAILAALFTKEHAVVAVAVLALDEWFDPRRDYRRSIALYVTVLALSVGWLFLWRAIAGVYVPVSVNATLRGLGMWERILTMLPVQFDVLRLLVWPMDLAADYNPNVILRRSSLSWAAVGGATIVGAALAIALHAARRAPAVTVGILVAAFTYSPTSNMIFASGVILAERNLYLAVVAPAFALGWLMGWPPLGRHRRAVVGALVLLIGAYMWRTVSRVPVWEDSASVVVEDFVFYQENYRARLRVGSYLYGAGDTAGSFAEIMAAAAIFPDDPFLALTSVPRATELGYGALALAEARRANAILAGNPRLERLLAQAFVDAGAPDSAIAVARSSVETNPSSIVSAQTYARMLAATSAASWRRHLMDARGNWLSGWMERATASVDSAVALLGPAEVESAHCWDLDVNGWLVAALRSSAAPVMDGARSRAGCAADRLRYLPQNRPGPPQVGVLLVR